MARHAPVVEHAGNTMTVIAPTAEEAMALIGDAGPGFRTTSIGKVRRGGLAGFFATELVRVVAEAPGAAPPPVAASSPLGLATADDLLASLCGTEGPFAGRLAAGIQRSLQAPPPAITPVGAPANIGADDFCRSQPPIAAPTDERPQRQESAGTDGAPANIGADDFCRSQPPIAAPTDERPQRQESAGVWSPAALEAVGLPARLVERVAGVRPYDDVTWNAALMLAVRDWCGADLPPAAVLAGPEARPLATALRTTITDADELAGREGPVAVLDIAAGALGCALGDRPLHLVVGGDWRHLATLRPGIVSAATSADLVDAVRVAAAWDAPLGWVHDGDGATRIDPFLVAGHLRALLAADAPRTSAAGSGRPRSARRSAMAATPNGGGR